MSSLSKKFEKLKEGISCLGPIGSGKKTFIQTLQYFLYNELPKNEYKELKELIQKEIYQKIYYLLEEDRNSNLELERLKSIENSSEFFYQLSLVDIIDKVNEILERKKYTEVYTFLK